MRVILEILISLPIPLFLSVAVGLVFWNRRRLSFALIFGATVLMIGFSMPIVADLLAQPLALSKAPMENLNSSRNVAILVPTAGIFRDSNGRWWSNNTGIERAATGQRWSRDLELPLILSGGSPNGETRSEAEVLASQLGLFGPDIILETEARNTYETAVRAARIMQKLGGNHIVLVTSAVHSARMAASLRRQGLVVSAVPVRSSNGKPKLEWIAQFLPSAGGLGLSRAAIHEYLAILFYMIHGRIRAFDLVA